MLKNRLKKRKWLQNFLAVQKTKIKIEWKIKKNMKNALLKGRATFEHFRKCDKINNK